VTGVRALVVGLVALGLVPLAGCGGDDSTAGSAPGSPDNPLVARTTESASTVGRSNEAASPAHRTKGSQGSGGSGGSAAPDGGAATKPGYEQLVERQSSKPQSSFTPCNLVTRSQARAYVGAPVREPLEAAQGPTCIYQAERGKGFVTLAVQSVDFRKLKPRLQQPRRISVSERTAYCGQYGQAMLYVPLSRGRVLTVAGPCPVARQFAAAAVQRLKG
jgi:hypothetical protein